MNALQSYSSDEEENESLPKKINKMADPGTNYDDVGMDISEDSSDTGETLAETAHPDAANNGEDCSNGSKKEELPVHPRERKVSDDFNKKEALDKRKGRNSNDEKNKHERSNNSVKKRDRSRDRNSHEKNSVNSRDHNRDSRDHRDSRRSFDHRDSRRGNRDDRKSGRRSRSKSRSRSKDRRRSRSRSRSRDRDRRRRRTRTRSRSRDRDRDRRRPHEIRKEAQQKLAAFKALNPDVDHNELLKRGMEAQYAEVQKSLGVTLPSYYNPAIMNPVKIAEQERKKKLLWGNKNKPVETTGVVAEPTAGGSSELWVNTKFCNDSDGRMAEKFKRLMGVKSGSSEQPKGLLFKGDPSGNARTSVPQPTKDGSEIMQKQETMFSSMEKQYETARLATHTHKGFGLGFTSQTFLPK